MKSLQAKLAAALAALTILSTACATDSRGRALDRVVHHLAQNPATLTTITDYTVTRIGNDIVLQTITPANADPQGLSDYIAAQIVLANPADAEALADLGTRVISIVPGPYGHPETSLTPISTVLNY